MTLKFSNLNIKILTIHKNFLHSLNRVYLVSLIVLLWSALTIPIYSEDCGTLINPLDKTISLKGGWLFQKGDNQSSSE